MMMMVLILMVTMVAALRKSCSLIQLIVGGLLTQMENDNGRWNKWMMGCVNDVSMRHVREMDNVIFVKKFKKFL